MAQQTKNGFQGEAYQPQEDVFFDDGREIELLHFIYNHPSLAQMRGNPDKVLDAIDEYGRTKKYLMNVGSFKAKIVTDLIKEVKPKIMVELGGYVGYSTIAFGAAVRESGGQRYYSLERNPEFGAVITSLLDLAGLGDFVKVEIGGSAQSIKRLFKDGTLKHIDMLFLDHWKPAYTTDLKLCEELGLVGPGSVYAADNVVKPGNPPYLEYVRSTVAQKRKAYQETAGLDEGQFSKWVQTQYLGREGDEILDRKVRGNPNLVYESQFVEGWEPSGVPDAVEVTRCKGVEN